jgi:hypothetical protein
VVDFSCDVITFGVRGRGVYSSAAFTLKSCRCGMVIWIVTACSLQDGCGFLWKNLLLPCLQTKNYIEGLQDVKQN